MEINKKKILHFEDQKILCDICKPRFMDKGFIYKSYNSYENFMQIILDEQPDLIICDILIPGINGYDAIRMLRSDERTKKIPFVIFTNLYGDQEIKKGMDAGAAKYLFKQKFGPNEFVEEIRDVLDRSIEEVL